MYYCLISSLAELSIGQDPRQIDYAAVREEIAQQLSASDARAMALLYTYYDVVNLLSAMRDSDLPHNELGNLSHEEIVAEIAASGTDDEPFVSRLPGAIRGSLDLYQGRSESEEPFPVDDI
ncbi:MAG: DUF2764 family protein, partial [Mucinivorans sp.]